MQDEVTLLYFAWLREKTGVSEEHFALPQGVTTIDALIDALRQRNALFASAFATEGIVRAAVNQVFVQPGARVAPGDEIAFFPPVTGG